MLGSTVPIIDLRHSLPRERQLLLPGLDYFNPTALDEFRPPPDGSNQDHAATPIRMKNVELNADIVRHPYRMLGSYRALLAIFVLVSHTSMWLPPWVAPLALGNVGVLSFFVLSGFVIAEAGDVFYPGMPHRFLPEPIPAGSTQPTGGHALSLLPSMSCFHGRISTRTPMHSSPTSRS
jgi:hypothetical protein